MSDERPRNEAAMADILASIRKIVADEDRRGAQTKAPLVMSDVLLLTPEMRLPPDPEESAGRAATDRPSAPLQRPNAAKPSQRQPFAFTPSEPTSAGVAPPSPAPIPPATPLDAAAPDTVPTPEGALTPDEAAVVDIARAVLRDEFDGPFGRALTARIEAMIKAEVARALAAQERPQG